MSGPLQLDSEQLMAVSRALVMLTEMTEATGVEVSAYSGLRLEVADSTGALAIGFDSAKGQYVVDDRSGE